MDSVFLEALGFIRNLDIKKESEAEMLCLIFNNTDEKGNFNIKDDRINSNNIKSLFEKGLLLKDDSKRSIYSLFNEIEIINDSVKGQLNQNIFEKLETLKIIPSKLYVLSPKCKYSIGLYLLLKPFIEKRRPLGALVVDVKIQKLRNYLGVEDKYERISQLKDKVIQPSVNVINEAFDTHVDYSWVKEGKSVKSVRFTISDIKPIEIGGTNDE